MLTFYTYDDCGVFTGAVEIDPMTAVPQGTFTAPPDLTGSQVAQWSGAAWAVLPSYPPPPPGPSQFDLDKARYEKRAAAKNDLIAYMAADNMGRVRSGAWTVPQLMSLMDDPAVSAANAYMGTLSFELAAQAIATAATPLLTPEIRADWVGKLQAHYYLEG